MQRAVAIIPARYNSRRFPGKPLALLKGKPLIQYVCELAQQANLVYMVFVATDDERIYNTVINFGCNAFMTSNKHPSGTDRVAEVAGKLDCDLVVNIQADEPFLRPEMIDDVINILSSDEKASMSTLAKRITKIEEIFSPNVVKVVFDHEGFAMYFSRAPIPYHRDLCRSAEQQISRTALTSELCIFKHIGIYGYRRDTLLELASMKPDRLELIERLEQLRALACGIKIKVKETPFDTFGIDTIDDLKKAEDLLKN